jgi:hypothetical protein
LITYLLAGNILFKPRRQEEINAGCGTVAAQFDKGWLDHPFVTDYFSVNT